jgi:pimeloyl-ACP methyl ester carboxylesterase
MMSIWSDEAGPPGAPVVVLIHGSMDRATGMLRLSRRLDDRFRVLRYDRRGYGRSTIPNAADTNAFDMDHQVADLVELMAGRRALLVGHSYGGNVAMATAARHPHLVAAIALYETPLSWEPWWPSTTAGAAARASSADPAEAAERFMRRLVGDALWESLPERTRATRRAEGPAMVGELNDLRANRPWSPEQITCPLVVAYGSNGAAHHRQGMQYIHARFPGSSCVVLADCRHDAPMSQSQLFADLVVDPAARAAGQPWASAVSRSTISLP